MENYYKHTDIAFHLAGVKRPENLDHFMKRNFDFMSELQNCLKKYQNKETIILSSYLQATLAGRFGDSESDGYSRQKT